MFDRRWLLAVGLISTLPACGGSGAADGGINPGDAASLDGGPADSGPADGGERPAWLTRLDRPEDLATLTSTAGGGVKYLARVPGAAALEPLTEPCYFQDMSRYSWHLQFLRSFPELSSLAYDTYLALILKKVSRRYFGGALEIWSGALHPATSRPGVLAYSVYSEPNGLDAEDLVAAHGVLAAAIPFAAELLVFVPESPDQRALITRERESLAARGVATLFPEELLRGLGHQAYSQGEGYGTLRVIPRGQPLVDYGPRDVVVVESAPNDISIVAGLLTASPQNVLGHVNLRLREKGIPNAAVPDLYEAAWIAALADHLVHVSVTGAAIVVEPARLEDAERFWETHRPLVPPPTADLSVTRIASFTSLRHSDRAAYGTKAANLAELRSFLSPPAANDGLAIPFSRYRDFADGAGATPDLEVLLADPRTFTDRTFKREGLAALRGKLRHAPLPAGLLDELEAEVTAVFGESGRRTKLRFRSSTNVEDLDVFTGAGLYESRSGCLADDRDGDDLGPSHCLTAEVRAELERQLAERRSELSMHPERSWLSAIIHDLEEDLTEEKPVADAIRKVWASLFTDRAFDEREYYRIDHRIAYMGIAINPSFQLERVSAVAVTNLTPDSGLPLYRVNSQRGDVSVVQPEDPLAIAELFTLRRNGELEEGLMFQSYSSLVPEGTVLWPDPVHAELVSLLFRVHDHFTTVYPNLARPRFDLELKLTAAGDVVVKQLRPYVSLDPSGL